MASNPIRLIVDKYAELKKSFYNNDPNREKPQERKGLFAFANSFIQKKQQKAFVLNAQTLERLAKTDPVTWAILRTVKSKVNSARWDIVPDTEKLEKELDRWEEYAVESLNPYGLLDKPFDSELIDPDVFQSTGDNLTKILSDPLLGEAEKTKAVRWIFKAVKRQIMYTAQQHCEQVRPLFEKPNTSAETSLRALQELVINDLLIFDAGVLIKNYSVSGKLAELYTVPGHQIKLYRNEDRTTPQPPEPAYVWEDQGILRAEFTNEELIYIMMNPTHEGYGTSPLEVAAFIITASLYAEQYSIDYFKNSNVPPGVFSLGKDITEDQRRLFQTLWDNEVQGRAGGLHRMLFMAGSDQAKFIPLQNLSNREQQMMEYLNWSVSIKCACYGLTPQDIGFTQDNRGLGSGGVAEVQKQLTEARGIGTVLQLLEQYYNAEIVKSEFDFIDVKFEWQKDEDKENPQAGATDIADINAGVLTRNERRNKIGLKPVPGGDIITVTTGQGLMPVESLKEQDSAGMGEETGQLPPNEEQPFGEPGQEQDPGQGADLFNQQGSEEPQAEPNPFTEKVNKTIKKPNLRITMNKKMKNQKNALDNTVKKLRDSGIDAELRIGFKDS
jgi:phage portal protein BeeE